MHATVAAAAAARACLLSACVIELEQNKEEGRAEWSREGGQMLSRVSGHCHCDAADSDWADA